MRLRIALACALSGIAATSVVAQPADEPDSSSPAAAAAPAAAPLPDGRIRFSFKDASFEQVIEFFSRTTGLPVVWETDPPDGTLSDTGPSPAGAELGDRG